MERLAESPPAPLPPPIPRLRCRLAATASLLLTAGHLTAVVLYLLPTNVFNLRWQGLLEAYVQPTFSQNWHLFSPNPGISLVRLRLEERLPSGEVLPAWDPLKELRAAHWSRWRYWTARELRVYERVLDAAYEEVAEAPPEAELTAGLAAVLAAVLETAAGRELRRFAWWDHRRRFGPPACGSELRMTLLRMRPAFYGEEKEVDAVSSVHEVVFPWVTAEPEECWP